MWCFRTISCMFSPSLSFVSTSTCFQCLETAERHQVFIRPNNTRFSIPEPPALSVVSSELRLTLLYFRKYLELPDEGA